MAFNIVLQTNNSEKNRVDKEITDIITLSGTLKNDTSIINPVFTIQGDLMALSVCNYFTVETFGRSYFITDIISVRNGMVELHGHCDVLSSFKNQIRENQAIISKQEEKWNLYLNDGSFKLYQNPLVLTRPFPSGFNTQQFVLAVAGG